MKIIKVGILAILVGCIAFAIGIYKNIEEEPVIEEPVIEENHGAELKKVVIQGNYSLMNKSQKTQIKDQFKKKLIKNGKLQQGVLTLNEANLLLNIISEEYSNKTIENVQGNILEHLINNLK